MELYPLILETRLFSRVWGGQRLREVLAPNYDFALPLGEVWAVHGELSIANGPYSSRTLDDLWQSYPLEMSGSSQVSPYFPLLVKWLDTADWLSLQVHPDDTQARLIEGRDDVSGKIESWYVIEVNGNGELICGCRSESDVVEVAELSGRDLLSHLHYQRVKPGDFLFVPAGTIHALGPGITVLEVQQSSNITYRFYDWDRPPIAEVERPLHVRQARQAFCHSRRVEQTNVEHDYLSIGSLLTANTYFAQELVSGCGNWHWSYRGLELVIALEGQIVITINNNEQILDPGAIAVIPAAAAEVNVTSDVNVRFMRVMCPSDNTDN